MRRVFSRPALSALFLFAALALPAAAASRDSREPGWIDRILRIVRVHILGDEMTIPPPH